MILHKIMEDTNNYGWCIQFQKLSKVSGMELNNFFESSFFDGLRAMKEILHHSTSDLMATKILDRYSLAVTDIIHVHANSQGKAVFVVSNNYEYYATVTVIDGEVIVMAVYDDSTDEQVYPEDLLENNTV